MEVNRAVIVYVDTTMRIIFERTGVGVRIEVQDADRDPPTFWETSNWAVIDRDAWAHIVAAMADTAATEVIPHG